MSRTRERADHFEISKIWLIPVLLALITLSCNQQSIFYDISNEPEPKNALVSGSPTNMAVLRNQLFVGSRMNHKIFRFADVDGDLKWTSFSLPEGSLGELATDGTYLYALVFPDGDPLKSSKIIRLNAATMVWEAETSMPDYSIQSLYSAGGRIFAGAQFKDDYQNYVIVILDSSTYSLRTIKYGTSLLTGAARDTLGTIYLSTSGSGILLFTGETQEVNTMNGTANANIAGIISAGGTVIAVGNKDYVFYRNSSGGFSSFQAGVTFTGAMCVWKNRNNQWKPSLLLMGIRGESTSVTHGYREMTLEGSEADIYTIRVPGENTPTSVKNRAKYTASLGTHAIEAILQVPDASEDGPLNYNILTADTEWEPLIFASTATSGLWSYRDGEWNAEE